MMTKLSLTTALLTICGSFAINYSSQAQSAGRSALTEPRQATRAEQRPSLGILGGVTSAQDGQRASANWGVEFGLQPIVPFSTALEVGGYSSRGEGQDPSLTRTRALLKGAYNFGGDVFLIKYTQAGLGLGAVVDNVRNSVVTELGIMPYVGFDIPLTNATEPHFTLGGRLSYLFVTGAKPDTAGVDAVAKYWF